MGCSPRCRAGRREGRARARGVVQPGAACLVQKTRSRSAMAPDEGPVPGSRFGGDAAADAGSARRALLRSSSDAISHARGAGGSAATSRARKLGGTGVLRACPESARALPPGSGAPGRPRGAEGATRHRAVHGGRRRVVRVREAGSAGGYQRRAGPPPRLRAAREHSDIARTEEALGDRRKRTATHRPIDLGAQSGDHGARGPRVHRADRTLSALSRCRTL